MEPETDTGSVSGVSLGSDAASAPWYTEQASLDMPMCCNLVCMALAVLHRMKRYHTVVQVMLLLTPALHTSADVPGVFYLRQICRAACDHVASSAQINSMNILRRGLMSLLFAGDNVPQSQ